MACNLSLLLKEGLCMKKIMMVLACGLLLTGCGDKYPKDFPEVCKDLVDLTYEAAKDIPQLKEQTKEGKAQTIKQLSADWDSLDEHGRKVVGAQCEASIKMLEVAVEISKK